MNKDVTGKRVAILATNGFEQSELLEPRKALDQARVKTEVVSLEPGQIKGWSGQNWGQSVPVDVVIDQADANN